jgi:hypothetical protein
MGFLLTSHQKRHGCFLHSATSSPWPRFLAYEPFFGGKINTIAVTVHRGGEYRRKL